MYTLIRLLVISLLLTACAPVAQNALTTADYAKSQPPSYPVKEYIIQPGDQIEIKFFYNPELNELATVRPDGRISLQLTPEVTAAGLTPAQLTDVLTKNYSKELAHPGIAVLVRLFSSQRVHVDGEVNKPGMVSLIGPTTVLEAVAEAGGFKDSARKEEVIIIRKTADKKPLAIVANLESAISGDDRRQDIQVLPYDIIFVPRSKIGDVNRFVDLYIRRNIPIPFGITYGFGGTP
jgi:protein involved in polysaccharide export with SLBB domain